VDTGLDRMDASSSESRPTVGPTLSVVIPTRNRAGLLPGAISSVLRSPLISSPSQIIVVADDCSEETSEVAAEYGTTYLRVGYRNAGASRNAGWRISATPYVSFLDDDDVWLPGNMEPQLTALEAEPNAAFAYSKARLASEDMEPLVQFPPGPEDLIHGLAPQRLFFSFPQLGVVLFRRWALMEVGGFDSNMTFAEDGDLLLRIGARHPIVGIDSVGMLHRVRTPSRTRSDYYWSGRTFIRWWPKELGIGWSDYMRHGMHTRGVFAFRFCEDFFSCARQHQRHEAMLCMVRALRISPPHTLLRNPLFWSGLRHLLGAPVSERVWWDRSGLPA
jgi:glycosyltransferase involved in cell wall biosynthesis